MNILISAGPTIEDIDPVRFISNRATGKLGTELAAAALKEGHRVTLVHGPVPESVQKAIAKLNGVNAVAVRSASEMRDAQRPGRQILGLWGAVAAICTVATVVGYAVADSAGEELRAAIDGFAAGALLVMLIDSMIPEATGKAGRVAGLVTTLGFAVAAGLSQLGG